MGGGQDWGLVMVLGGAALVWLLMLGLVVYLANASALGVPGERPRAQPAPPPAPPEPPEDEPLPALDEAERPMAVVIVAAAHGPGRRGR